MARPARWLLPQADADNTAAIASALGLHAPAARLLVNRGFRDPNAARRFLSPALEDLHDPFLLRDMDRACTRLGRAICSREKILLYGDYDVDGTTSVVLLKKAIELAGGNAGFHIPHRLREGYGMRPEVIEQASREGVSLVISVDTGIRAAEVVRHATGLGIDVIVTDHHLPEADLPPALAVLNPNRPDCGYPEKDLCGAGVAFKLAHALFSTLGWKPEKVRRMLDSFLKLAAIATIADVVPLVGENRIIVKRGLAGLREIRNPGLRALLEIAGFQKGDSPTAGQVAFRLAPRINAAGRMASASDVIELFLTNNSSRALELAKQLHELNTERQEAEAAIVRSILEECERVPVTDDHTALVFAGMRWHRGVLGIVASRLVERFYRPAFVLSDDGDGILQGSGRSVRGFHLLEALESMPEVFTKFGGHRQAAGLTLPSGRLEEFRERLNSWARARLSADDFRPTVEFDGQILLSELTDDAAEEILSLAPFGCGNPTPLFALMDAEILEAAPWKEKHARLRLAHGSRKLSLKAWNFAERLSELGPGSRIDAAISIEEDSYSASRGFPGWCAVLKEVRPPAATSAA
jgi:single-stranded-DNA-specific exonuclease